MNKEIITWCLTVGALACILGGVLCWMGAKSVGKQLIVGGAAIAVVGVIV